MHLLKLIFQLCLSAIPQQRSKLCKKHNGLGPATQLADSIIGIRFRICGCFSNYCSMMTMAKVALCCVFAMSAAHSALLTYNAALNRPAYQSSVYSHWSVNDTWNANLSTDGSHETHAYKDNIARCSVSNNETNPWWAVDLGRPTAIYRVDLTNREDGIRM